jgi:hypothetical protein
VWLMRTPFTMALVCSALNCTLTRLSLIGRKLEDFTYNDNRTLKILMSCMQNESFHGVSVGSGRVDDLAYFV